MVVHVRTHVQVGFANPYLICDECKSKVRYWHNPELCGNSCNVSTFNYPCGHVAGTTSKCLSWGPVDGCSCKEKHSK